MNESSTGRTYSTGGHENTRIFPPVPSRLPLTPSAVPEGLPLCWEITVTSGDTEQEGVVLLESSRVLQDFIIRFWWSMHLAENFFRKCLRDSLMRVSIFLECAEFEGRAHTDRWCKSHLRPQYPSSRPQLASEYGHTWSTAQLQTISHTTETGGRKNRAESCIISTGSIRRQLQS
jgi:hypothetical protein